MNSVKILYPTIAAILLMAFFFSCGNHQQAVTQKPKDSIKVAAEYLDWDSVRINNSAHVASTPKALYAAIGKPDSVVTTDIADACGTYFDQSFKYVAASLS